MMIKMFSLGVLPIFICKSKLSFNEVYRVQFDSLPKKKPNFIFVCVFWHYRTANGILVFYGKAKIFGDGQMLLLDDPQLSTMEQFQALLSKR